jgi:cell division protein FtsI (penicillin-binding protein 3)
VKPFVQPLGRAGWTRVRIVLLMVALSVGAAAVAHGAWDLGVTRRGELVALADEQYTRSVELAARRGAIIDRHGKELASEAEVDSCYVDPRRVGDAAGAARALAPILGKDEASLLGKLTAKKKFVWLKRRIAPSESKAVRALRLPGIELVKESRRYYPNRALAAHVIGFAGVDANGLDGIEKELDDQLQGNSEAAKGVSDARGRIVFSDGLVGLKGMVGNTVQLTIDAQLQYIAESELANTVRVFEAKSGHAIVMDPTTGEILALANWPAFDPNMANASSLAERRNRAVLDVYEPGSTFKVFTLAAALNSGKVRPAEEIFCENGRMEMFDVVIHDDHRDGWLNTTECLKRSSNICFAKIAARLSKERFYYYIRRFGFGERTHVTLPSESPGMLTHYKKWYDVDTATIAFGQGIGVTGLQMATALSAIANGGNLMRPQLVKSVRDPDGETVRQIAPEILRRVVSRYTARLVADMMTAVTETGGTGEQGSLDGFLVAGKTGTAQKSDGHRGYAKDKWISSFFAFVPADRPRLLISVVIDEPLISKYGGAVAAPAVRRIADQGLRYLGVSPRVVTKSAAAKPGGKAGPDGKAPRGGKAAAEPEGEDPPVETAPAALQPGQIRTPALVGQSMIDAIATLATSGLRPMFLGTGVAVEQIPAPEEPIDAGGFVQVNFQPVPPDPAEDGDDGENL